MYAIVKTGGKQYRVEPGASVQVERLPGTVGEKVTLDEVLLVSQDDEVKVGTPSLKGARVIGEITAQGRGRKIIVFKKKRRKNYRRKAGHRQEYTEIKVTDIVTD
ncbi:MAG: 50S ribosomal protein L21 [Deltaproteobacteria bacterium]|nr:MAG: 50S ribosomal protein L21 [Deltaproteobacteria bacterium]